MDNKDEDDTMAIELMKLRATEKQTHIKQIWGYTYEQVEDFFVNYPLFGRLGLNIGELIQKPNIRIVQNEHRVYFGETHQHRKHGIGVSLYRDGRVYEGGFKNNDKDGFGYEIYPNGNVYIGHYESNKKHGEGTFYWFNMTGAKTEYYKGHWWVGLPAGKGVHERANGDYYEGQFQNGLKHGEGSQRFANGDYYTGHYTNGFPDGYGQYFWNDGSHYKGDFKQGLRNGFGVWKKSNKPHCQSYKGHYIMDKKSGYGLYMWNQGDYYKGHFFDDLKHGLGELYNNNISSYYGMWQYGQKAPHLNHLKDKDKTLQRTLIRPMSYNSTRSIKDLKQLSETGGRPTSRKRTQSTTPDWKHKKQDAKSSYSTVPRKSVREQKNPNHNHGDDTKSISASGRSRCGHKNCIPSYEWLKPSKKH